MNENLRRDAENIVRKSIEAVLPDAAVKKALAGFQPPAGRMILVSVGKAGYRMAKAALSVLPQFDAGIVITKYGHIEGSLDGVECYEAGHPVPDENSFAATKKALEMTADLSSEDTVIFLLSGGGSALFEEPLIPGGELADITNQLLASGASIQEMNTVRKRLSRVKGGRFGAHCAPARVFSVVLSDIVGDPLDMIASGPAVPDTTTCADALEVVKKYDLKLSDGARQALASETPRAPSNVETKITGSVRELCRAAAKEAAEDLGYEPLLLTDSLTCEAREAGRFLGAVLKTNAAICNEASAAGEADETSGGRKLAFIAGGETVVHLTGQGLGGRNQELALAAAPFLSGFSNAALISVGSDGTDGPTDAAGGYVDGDTEKALAETGLDVAEVLQENDAYHALQAAGGLIITGPTGTNVNDVAVGLIGHGSA